MQTVRRIYLYLVSALSLIAVTWAVISLARLVLDNGIGSGQISGLAWSLAVIIVGLPIFLFHWLMAQRLAAGSPAEQQSPIRYFFFFAVMAAGATPIVSNVYRLVDDGLMALLGVPPPSSYPYDLTVIDHVVALIVWTVVWLYVWRFVQGLTQQPMSPVQSINLTLRRLYLLIFSLAGLMMVAWGAFGLLQTLMQSVAGFVWKTPVANYTSQLLIGSVVWVGHWRILQNNFASARPAEERSVLRKVYLYVTVFLFSVTALSSGTMLLKRIFELLLGAPPSGEPLLSQLSTAVPMLIVGAVFWAYHWSVVRQDADQAPEAPRQAGVRRIYAYLVAAVGLAALLTGVGGLLIQLVDMLTASFNVGLASFREAVALFAAMTLVGTPVWWLPWQAMQSMAAKAELTETSTAERRSTVRKMYLYFYVFLASLGIFGSVGWFVYHILTALLGAKLPTDFITQVFDAFVIAMLAAGVWLYHWWAIRRDGQLAEQDQAGQLTDVVVVVIDGDEGRLGQAVLGKLKNELPGVRLKPLGVTPQATAAMSGEPFSAAMLEMANYIIGSWQALSAGEVGPAVAANSATKLVVPLAGKDWVWAGVKRQSPEDYAEQVVKGVRQAIDGEEIQFGQGLDAATVAGIVIGGIIFLCLIGNVLGVAAEFIF